MSACTQNKMRAKRNESKKINKNEKEEDEKERRKV